MAGLLAGSFSEAEPEEHCLLSVGLWVDFRRLRFLLSFPASVPGKGESFRG